MIINYRHIYILTYGIQHNCDVVSVWVVKSVNLNSFHLIRNLWRMVEEIFNFWREFHLIGNLQRMVDEILNFWREFHLIGNLQEFWMEFHLIGNLQRTVETFF